MKQFIYLSFVIILCTYSLCSGQVNPGFDTSGVERFFKIQDLLINSQEPGEKEWTALLSGPGYEELVRKEIPRERFIDIIKAAYKPDYQYRRAEIMAEAEKAEGWFWKWFPGSFLETLDYCRAHKDRIRETLKSFSDYDYVNRAREHIAKYLPGTLLSTEPQIAFIVFNDSRGYTPVILSITEVDRRLHGHTATQLKRLSESGWTGKDVVTLYLAHEMFHLYRSPAVEISYPEGDTIEGVLLSCINRACNEGIADMINVYNLYDAGRPLFDSDYGRQIAEEQSKQIDALKAFDSVCRKLSGGSIAAPEAGKELRRIFTRSGHPIGYFMVKQIFRVRGSEGLKAVACKPMDFILLYNEVAQDSSTPAFSEATLALLHEVRGRFGRKSTN